MLTNCDIKQQSAYLVSKISAKVFLHLQYCIFLFNSNVLQHFHTVTFLLIVSLGVFSGLLNDPITMGLRQGQTVSGQPGQDKRRNSNLFVHVFGA